jgi:hypothetical protein
MPVTDFGAAVSHDTCEVNQRARPLEWKSKLSTGHQHMVTNAILHDLMTVLPRIAEDASRHPDDATTFVLCVETA